MNFLLWILVGGVLGWIASLIMRTDESQGLGLNIIVGIAGAFIGGFVFRPYIGSGTINAGDYSFDSLLTSLVGSIVLLALVNLIRLFSRSEGK